MGFDQRRLNMLLAVLEKRIGMKMFQKDVFLNFAGGFKISDTGIDLAVVGAIILPQDLSVVHRSQQRIA